MSLLRGMGLTPLKLALNSKISFTNCPVNRQNTFFIPSIFSNYRNLHKTTQLQDSFHIQDDEDFDKRVLQSKKPVVVQFHATWCGPCKHLSPRLEKVIAATNDKVDLAQVDIDNHPDLAMSYSVGAVPAVMAVKDGKVVDKFVGLKDEDQVDTFVAQFSK